MSSTRVFNSTVVTILFVFVLHTPSFSKVLGVTGRVYPIIEKDALEEIEERARGMDWGAYLDPERWKEKIRNYRPPDLRTLSPAESDTSFLVDMTYTLEFDIPDGKGGILYPRGFTFNPLEYVPFSLTIVVLDGTREEEVSWFVESEFSSRPDTMVLITDGSWYEISKRLKRPVFYLTLPIAERLSLRHTPSVVTKKDTRFMEVREIHVGDEKDTD